jgi:hypothetical protein
MRETDNLVDNIFGPRLPSGIASEFLRTFGIGLSLIRVL